MGGGTVVNNSTLLPVVYDIRRVESLIGVGRTGVNNSPLLPLAYDNSIVDRLIGGWTGVINSPLLPLYSRTPPRWCGG